MELTTSSNRSSESDPDAARHQRYLLHHDVACRVFFVFFLYCDSLIFQPVKTVQSSTKRDNKVVASLKILYSVNIRHCPRHLSGFTRSRPGCVTSAIGFPKVIRIYEQLWVSLS